MRKEEFLCALKARLSNLSQEDMEERLNFYREMIDDRMDDGLSEEDAVAQMGTVDEVAMQILTPFSTTVKEKNKGKKQRKTWEIVLLALGSPVWLSILVSGIAVIFSVYASLWAAVVSLWAGFASMVGCALAGVVAGAYFAFGANLLTGIAVFGGGLVCAGVSIFAFYGSKFVTKWILSATKKLAIGLKKLFIKRRMYK